MPNEKLVADIITACLARHGVEILFSQSLPSAALLAAEDAGIRQFTYRTENAGGAMADGYARVSGRVAVVTAQNGPAATLLVAQPPSTTTASRRLKPRHVRTKRPSLCRMSRQARFIWVSRAVAWRPPQPWRAGQCEVRPPAR